MRHRLSSCLLVAVVIAIALPASSGTFSSPMREIFDKAQCRMSYARSVRALSVSLSLRVSICHRDRLRGKLPVSLECNDPWGWLPATYPKGYDGVVHDLDRYAAESRLCTPTVTMPTQVGYLSCPAPCEAITIGTFVDWGNCLECVNRPLAQRVWESALGSPPVSGERFAAGCQSIVGRGILRYAHKLMKLQASCEFLVEISKPPFVGQQCTDLHAPGHPYALRVARFRERLMNAIQRRCSKADLPILLDTCGVDGDAEALCVVTAVEQWAVDGHPPIYPPLPPP